MQTQDIITQAAKHLNVIAAGETLSTEELADGLFALQRLIDHWNAQQLAIYQIVNIQFSCAASQNVYTIGSGGNWNTPRPEKIIAANAIVGGIYHTIRISSAEDFARIEERGAQGNRTLDLWNDAGYPLSHISIWPTPYGGNVPVIELFMWQLLQQFTSLGDTFDFPPGYARAIIYNLAVDMAPQFGRQAPADVLKVAAESKQQLERQELSQQLAVAQTAIPPSPVAPAQ